MASYGTGEAASAPTRLHAVTTSPLMDDPFAASGRHQVLTVLAAAMNDHLGVATGGEPSVYAPDGAGAPVLYIGSAEGPLAPAGAESVRTDYDEYAPLVVHLQYPSATWSLAVAEELAARGDSSAVLLWIGFSHYPKADRGLFGKKVVLGTGYEAPVPFLSSMDEPVELLQVSGVLVDRTGRVVRAAAEGIVHKETPFWAQTLGLRRELDHDEVARVIEGVHRDDLPARPLAWEAALTALLESLVPGGYSGTLAAPAGA